MFPLDGVMTRSPQRRAFSLGPCLNVSLLRRGSYALLFFGLLPGEYLGSEDSRLSAGCFLL